MGSRGIQITLVAIVILSAVNALFTFDMVGSFRTFTRSRDMPESLNLEVAGGNAPVQPLCFKKVLADCGDLEVSSCRGEYDPEETVAEFTKRFQKECATIKANWQMGR